MKTLQRIIKKNLNDNEFTSSYIESTSVDHHKKYSWNENA